MICVAIRIGRQRALKALNFERMSPGVVCFLNSPHKHSPRPDGPQSMYVVHIAANTYSSNVLEIFYNASHVVENVHPKNLAASLWIRRRNRADRREETKRRA